MPVKAALERTADAAMVDHLSTNGMCMCENDARVEESWMFVVQKDNVWQIFRLI